MNEREKFVEEYLAPSPAVVVVRGVRWIGPGRVPLVVGGDRRARSAAEPSPSKATPAADPAETDPKEGAS